MKGRSNIYLILTGDNFDMTFIFLGLLFFLGCIVGSFLNVVIDRLPKGQSIVYPPSHCPHCRHRLGFVDLIPLFSFLLLQRKCRYCKGKISWYYPVVEATTGVLFALTAYIVKIPPNFPSVYLIYLLLIISALIVVFFTDLKYGIIPFKVVAIALVIITLKYLFIGFSCFNGIASPRVAGLAMTSCLPFNYFLSGIGVFLAFLLLFLATKGRGIGFGDVVYGLLMGYVLGFPKIIPGVYIAFLTGALVSLILIVAGKKKFKGGVIPFGPFLVTGTIVSLFWGQDIINRLILYFHV